MKLRDLERQTPPATLYHYTVGSAFLGIVRTKELWATHTQFLNDRTEFSHAVALVREIIKSLRDTSTAVESQILDEMSDGLDGLESINVCVVCFSTVADDLSQWRAYGASSGYCLGFAGDRIAALASAYDSILVPCVYEAAQQAELIRELVVETLAKEATARSGGGGMAHRPWRGAGLFAELNRYAPIFKHHSFKDEREWRLITRPLPSTHENFDYRPGRSSIVPYFRVPITRPDGSLPLTDVIVGPTPYRSETCNMTVRSFLAKHDLANTNVEASDVPYRNW